MFDGKKIRPKKILTEKFSAEKFLAEKISGRKNLAICSKVFAARMVTASFRTFADRLFKSAIGFCKTPILPYQYDDDDDDENFQNMFFETCFLKNMFLSIVIDCFDVFAPDGRVANTYCGFK